MTERHAILTAIRENRGDDTLRLVYADWLDEHGEPERAELIRVQIEIWRLGISAGWQCLCDSTVGVVCDWCRDREPLQKRERELSYCVIFPVSVFLGGGGHFERGICQAFECAWECWKDHGDAIWERELPWRVRLTTRPDDVVLDEWQPETPNLNPIWRWGFIGSHVAVDFKGGESRGDAIRRLLAARWPGIEFELPRADEISEESRAWGEERMRMYRELMDRLGLRQPEPILPDLPRG